MQLTSVDLTIVIIYLCAMLWVAVYYASKRIGSFEDYYLAGRRLTLPILIGTLISTYFGADSFVGDAEMGFGMGISGFFSYCAVAALLMVALAYVGASIKNRTPGVNTPIDVIGASYGPISRISCAVGSLCYVTPVVNVMGMGFVFKVVLGIEFWQGVVLGSLVATVYTFFGGMMAVALTDLIQYVILSIGVSLAVLIPWVQHGDRTILEGLKAFVGGDPSFYFQVTGGWMTPGLLITYAVTALSVLCEPTLFQRVYAARTSKDVRRALLVCAFMYLVLSYLAVMIGVVGAATTGLGKIKTVASESLVSVATNFLPVGFVGLFVGGFLAASMSTVDSMLLVAGGNLAYDLYKPLFKPRIGEQELVGLTKYGVLLASGVAILLSFYFGRVMGAWVFVASMLVNTTLIPLYGAVYLRRKVKLAGEISSAFGLVGTILYYFLVGRLGTFDETWNTYIWTVTLFGRQVRLWHEYNILIILPTAALLYFIAYFVFSRGTGIGKEAAR